MIIKSGQTSVKYLLIVVIVATVFGAGLSLYQKTLEGILGEPLRIIGLDTEVKTQEEYSVLDEVSFEGQASIKYYKFGTAEFTIYPLIEENGSFQFGYFEVYNKEKKIFSSKPIYKIIDLLSFKHKNDKYIIISDYSGGAHCCFQEYIFRLDKDNDLKLVKRLSTGNTAISEDNIVSKKGELYLLITDDRFAYFHTSYAASYFFDRYFLINEDKIVESSLDFKENYIKEARDCKKDLDDFLKGKTVGDFETWFPRLLCKVVNYLVIGDEKNAWDNFEEYFNQLSALAPPRFKEDNLYTIKQEIIEKMKAETVDWNTAE